MRRATTIGLLTAATAVLLLAGGCINVKAPEKISIGSEPPPPVDSSRIPETTTHEEARAELVKAYQNIQYLERENSRLHAKADEYKHERDDCRKRLKKFED